jgi:hypothetical protein
MNFGLTGPTAERGLLVVKDLMGIEVTEHRHRVNELNDLAGRDGVMIGIDLWASTGQRR